MRNRLSRIVLSIALLFIFASSSKPQIARAQSGPGTWSDYENISNTPYASTYPAMVADRAGNVHVVWGEDVGGPTSMPVLNPDGSPLIDHRGKQVNLLTNHGNTLYYTRWNGKQWIHPVDIQVAAAGLLRFPNMAIDDKGVLHLIWLSGIGRDLDLWYSQAYAKNAEKVSAWSKPVILVGNILAYTPSISISADLKGGIHIFYFRDGSSPGTFVINSFDGGDTWSEPILLFPNSDPNGTTDGSIPIWSTVDSKNRIHATWTRYDSTGNGRTIYYSQSTDQGRTWSSPFPVANWKQGWYEVDWLSVGVINDQIHLIWEGGPISFANEMISNDGGKTWGTAHRLFPDLAGENGYASQVVDSKGMLHVLLVKRTSGPGGITIYGMWYSTFLGNDWATPIMIDAKGIDVYRDVKQMTMDEIDQMLNGTINDDGLRYQQAVVVNGNRIIAVVVNEHDGDIYSTQMQLDAPYIAPRDYPEPALINTNILLTPTPARSTLNPIATLPSSERVFEDKGTSPGNMIMIGLAPVGLLILGLFFTRYFIRRSSS